MTAYRRTKVEPGLRGVHRIHAAYDLELCEGTIKTQLYAIDAVRKAHRIDRKAHRILLRRMDGWDAPVGTL